MLKSKRYVIDLCMIRLMETLMPCDANDVIHQIICS